MRERNSPAGVEAGPNADPAVLSIMVTCDPLSTDDVAISAFMTMEQVLHETIAQPHFYTRLLSDTGKLLT